MLLALNPGQNFGLPINQPPNRDLIGQNSGPKFNLGQNFVTANTRACTDRKEELFSATPVGGARSAQPLF